LNTSQLFEFTTNHCEEYSDEAPVVSRQAQDYKSTCYYLNTVETISVYF